MQASFASSLTEEKGCLSRASRIASSIMAVGGLRGNDRKLLLPSIAGDSRGRNRIGAKHGNKFVVDISR
jgi:hypothetical protein